MPDLRQILILGIALAVPAYCILAGKHDLLLRWICLTVCINLFDTRIMVNMPAARLAGLLLLPLMARDALALLRCRPAKALLAKYAYICLLGVAFGLISPWTPGHFARSFNQTAPWRALIYLVRTLGDVSLAFYVGQQLFRGRRADTILRYVLLGTSVAAVAGLIEYIVNVDIYGHLTGLRQLVIVNRMRGLNWEPRGLGLVTGQGLLLCLLCYAHRRAMPYLGLALVHAVALFLSGSTSALAAIIVAGMALMIVDRPSRRLLLILGSGAAALLAVLAIIQSSYLQTYLINIWVRFSGYRMTQEPRNAIEWLVFRMDVFDGPALLFMFARPLYALMGTGPGLICLPASYYIPPGEYTVWWGETGLGSPPSMGLLLEAANGGIIGLALWLMIVVWSMRAFRQLTISRRDDNGWALARGAFVVAAAAYAVQLSPLAAFWPVLMGTGIAAALLAEANCVKAGDLSGMSR